MTLKVLLLLLRISRGCLAGIGMAVSTVILVLNLPSNDPIPSGSTFVMLLIAVPLFAVFGVSIEILSLAIRARKHRESPNGNLRQSVCLQCGKCDAVICIDCHAPEEMAELRSRANRLHSLLDIQSQ